MDRILIQLYFWLCSPFEGVWDQWPVTSPDSEEADPRVLKALGAAKVARGTSVQTPGACWVGGWLGGCVDVFGQKYCLIFQYFCFVFEEHN